MMALLDQMRRLPHGRRGLKPYYSNEIASARLSPPAWEAWIETLRSAIDMPTGEVASRMGGVD